MAFASSFVKWIHIFFLLSRSTNQFTIYTSTEIIGNRWHLALVDNLPNPHGRTCEEIPTLGFEINQSGRYVKLTMDSTHGTSGTGLQYVDVVFTKACSGIVFLKLGDNSRFLSFQS